MAARRRRTGTFLTEMLAAVDPSNLSTDPVNAEPLNDSVTVVRAIEAAVKILDAEAGVEGALKGHPLVRSPCATPSA